MHGFGILPLPYYLLAQDWVCIGHGLYRMHCLKEAFASHNYALSADAKNANFSERARRFNCASALDAVDRSGCSWVANNLTGPRDRV